MNRLISTTLCLLALAIPLHAAEHRVAVVPVEFSDVSFQDKTINVDKKVARAKEYFNDQFSPYRSFRFDVLPTVKLSRAQSWYGANSTTRKDERIDQLVRDACLLLSGDMSVYDNDGDGIIDNICIITSGGNEADGDGVDCIWPQQGFLNERGGTASVSGKTVDCFTVCSEKAGLGTFCHEFAHSFGLQDLYDTDGKGSGGESSGVWGSLSLMDKGSANDGGNTPPNFCAIELEQLGIGKQLPLVYGYNTLRPVGSSKEYIRIDSDTEGEYFLLECRDNKGWDTCAGGSGLLIYHIDRSENDSWYSDYFNRNLSASERWQNNQVNCRPDHQCAIILAATPGTDDISRIFFPQPGKTIFGAETDPAFRYWNGNTATQIINDITSSADGSVIFSIIIPIVLNEMSVFQDAVILNWTTGSSLVVNECEVSWQEEGNQSSFGRHKTKALKHSEEHYSATLEGLTPATAYKITIKAICSDGTVHSKTDSFTTKSLQKNARPFIYLRTVNRNDDGSLARGEKLPLRVYNVQNADAVVEWFFDEKPIVPGSDGFWHITYSGTLKAKVRFPDGSTEVLVKELTVR